MKVGEYKGITIYFNESNKDFYANIRHESPILRSWAYFSLTSIIDRKLKERDIWTEDLKPTPDNFPTKDEMDGVMGFKNYSNINFTNCNFITPEGYDKLSAEDKTLIENLIKSLNEKK